MLHLSVSPDIIPRGMIQIRAASKWIRLVIQCFKELFKGLACKWTNNSQKLFRKSSQCVVEMLAFVCQFKENGRGYIVNCSTDKRVAIIGLLQWNMVKVGL